MLQSQVSLVLRLNSNILYEYQWCLCKLFRYASPRPDCVSDYKSTSHDSEALALSHSVAMGWRLSTRPADQKTIKTCSPGPSGTKHGRTSGQHMAAAQTRRDLYSHTPAASQKTHMGVDQYLTSYNPLSASCVPRLVPLVMHSFTFTLQLWLRTWHGEQGAIFKTAARTTLPGKKSEKQKQASIVCGWFFFFLWIWLLFWIVHLCIKRNNTWSNAK